jgi:hypothetical protein
MIDNLTPVQFENIPKMIGFNSMVSKSGRFKVWRREDTKLYLITPTSITDEEGFDTYFEDNIQVLRKILNIDKDYSTDEFKDIVLLNKYPINNRIETCHSFVPSDYLFNLLSSTINAYRYFREYNKDFKKISKKNFEIGHSKKGSYKIPILVSVENSEIQDLLNTDLNTKPLISSSRQPNVVLKSLLEFSKSLNELNKLPKLADITKFIDVALENNLNSHIVETFLSPSKSFQRIKKEYMDIIPNSYIEFESNPILDYDVENNFLNFARVSTEDFNPVTEESIEKLRDYENEQHRNNLDIENALIEVVIDNLSPRKDAKPAKVKVLVSAVYKNDELIYNKSFTAIISGVSSEHYKKLSDWSNNNSVFKVIGDINKPPGKSGEIAVTRYLFESKTEIKKDDGLFNHPTHL